MPTAVADEFRRDFRSEPATFAAGVGADRVLLFLGRCDDKVPFESGLLLREKLGKPETYFMPLGHYTSVLAAPWAARVALAWLRARLDAPESKVSEASTDDLARWARARTPR